MQPTDDFRISPDDGYRYSAPPSDEERRTHELGYLVLVAVVVLVMLALSLGWVQISPH